MTDKPSQNEEEYFAKRDAEILKARREATARAQADAQRKSHLMKCPKCGADLHTESYHGVQVDRCKECLGIWLDAGEAETMLKHEEGGRLGQVLRSVVRGLRNSGIHHQGT